VDNLWITCGKEIKPIKKQRFIGKLREKTQKSGKTLVLS
jgi:hypothetical protein